MKLSQLSILALSGDLVWRLIEAFPESNDPLKEGDLAAQALLKKACGAEHIFAAFAHTLNNF